MNQESLEVLDAKGFVALSWLISCLNDINKAGTLEIIKLAKEIGEDKLRLLYCTPVNILKLLINYTPIAPVNVQAFGEFAWKVIEGLIQGKDRSYKEDLGEKLEAVVQLSKDESGMKDLFECKSPVIFGVADSIMNDILSANLGMSVESLREKGPQEIYFLFLKGKILASAKYSNDVSIYRPLFGAIEDYEGFKQWKESLIEPYTYYLEHIGVLEDSRLIPFNDFMHASSSGLRLELMLQPLKLEELFTSLHLENYFSRIIWPLIGNNISDMGIFTHCIFIEIPHMYGKGSRKYSIWNTVMRVLLNFEQVSDSTLFLEKYQQVFKYYLGAIYYYSIFEDTSDNISSIDMIKILDSSQKALETIITKLGLSNDDAINLPQIDITEIDRNISLDDFISNGNFSILLNASTECFNRLQRVLSTCSKLYPFTKFCVKDYFRLTSELFEAQSLEKELTKLTVGLNDSNWRKILAIVEVFTDEFMKDPLYEKKIKEILVYRFLATDLYDTVEYLFTTEELSIPLDSMFTLVLQRFWVLFNAADSLDSKHGELKKCNKCIRLCDTIYNAGDLSQNNTSVVKKIKHLMKAIDSLKDFKLSIQRNVPITPKKVVEMFVSNGSFDGDGHHNPLSLVSLVVQQNRKSYLAFEKLFKILNDLMLFLDDQPSKPTFCFNKLKSICIEAALIDDNFKFAYRNSIEILDHYSLKDLFNLNDFWLTFYQVGKYRSPQWAENSTRPELELDFYKKQRDILARMLKLIEPSNVDMDNTRLVLQQWNLINKEIELLEARITLQSDDLPSLSRIKRLPEELTGMANDILTDATVSTSQAGEKLSNLFVSGLGWAIGASNK